MKPLAPKSLILVAAFALAITTTPVISDETDDAIQNIIMSQIEAFAKDDKEAAWGYASEGIKRRLGSIDTFYNMVKLSYAPIYRASYIDFMERVPHRDFQIQAVRLKGPEGKRWRAIYRMVQNDDQWRISGVVLKKAPEPI